MGRPVTAAMAWPTLRQELTLHIGPRAADGAPTWTLHDPARNRYFALDWPSFAVMSRLALGSVAAIADTIAQETPLRLTASDVEIVLSFLASNELLTRSSEQGADWLTHRHTSAKHSWMQSLIHGYLFFRVPLFNPDAWLTRSVPHLNSLFTRGFALASLSALLLGLWSVWRQWSVFSTTLVDTFSWSGFTAYAGALIAVKLLHELGHAVVAKREGCRVSAMGVAFLVLWPMAYTDVTESWKLSSHAARLRIAVAGIATELVVAAWALAAWALLPEGSARSASFFLATTSIVATLAINASPFMRFDGYFILSDLLGISNLHARSFAMARWWLREQLFGLGQPMPETFSQLQRRGLIAFALVTWLYRLVLFIGIALMVYHLFFKAIGLLLFVVEIWYFLLRPIWTECQYWWEQRQHIAQTNAPKRLAKWAVLALLLLLLPWDLTVSTQGLLRPSLHFNVVTPVPGWLSSMPWKIGDRIPQGTPLLALSAPELDFQLAQRTERLTALEKQIGLAGFDPASRSRQALLQQQATAEREAMEGLLQEKANLSPTAPFDAQVMDMAIEIHPGEPVPRTTLLMTIAAPDRWTVDTYVTETDLHRLRIGAPAWFVPEGFGRQALHAEVAQIFPDATQAIDEQVLGSPAGGELLARTQGQTLVPERAMYRVRLNVMNQQPQGMPMQLRGRVTLLAWPSSIAGETLKHAVALLIREFSF